MLFLDLSKRDQQGNADTELLIRPLKIDGFLITTKFCFTHEGIPLSSAYPKLFRHPFQSRIDMP